MRAVVVSPAALARLADIFAYSPDRFGEAQAEAYAARLTGRLRRWPPERGQRRGRANG